MEFYNSILRKIASLQFEYNQEISSILRNIDDGGLNGLMIILAISFIYGVIHAVGPGHGKAMVSFYFLSSNANYKKAFKMGYLVAIFHAVSALSITMVIYYLLHGLFSKTFHQMTHISLSISAVLIILVGFYLIYEAYKHRFEKEKKFTPNNKNDIAVAFSAGIVPCPGVMTIVLFSISLGHIGVGILSAFAMSIGMGLTISLAGILSVSVKKSSNKFLSEYGYILEIISGFLVLSLGAFLLYSAY
jgi:ABC-type nickel/cobalt efflux system permease component RcnA